MEPDDIQQIGRIISVLSTCQEKLEVIMKNSGSGTDSYDLAEMVSEKVLMLIDEVAECIEFRPK